MAFDARQAHQMRFAFDGPAAAPVKIQMGFVEPTWTVGSTSGDPCSISQYGTDPSKYYLLSGRTQAKFLMHTLWQQPGATDASPSPYYYELLNTQAGLPTDPTFNVRSADLAQVKTTYRGEGTGVTYPITISTQPSPGGQNFNLAVHQTAPATVTWYRTPGIQWEQGVKSNTLWESGPYTAYPVGPSSEVWHAAVIGPEVEDFGSTAGVDQNGLLWYVGNEFLISPTPGHHDDPHGLPGITSTLTRDGVALPLGESGVSTVAKVAPGTGHYALTVTADHPLAGSKISTYVQAAWNFTIDSPIFGWQALPLLYVRMTPQGLDDSNRAVVGTQTTIPISVDRQPQAAAATIANVQLESSTDNGATWQPLTVTSTGNGWTTTITNPATAGFVSLRATATDSTGNSLTETVLHAYEVAN